MYGKVVEIDDGSEPGAWAEAIKMNEAMSNDVVDRPAHYNQGGIECIAAIEASMGGDAFKGYLKGSVLKYLWRYEHKGRPVEDLRKARWFLDRLIAVVGGGE